MSDLNVLHISKTNNDSNSNIVDSNDSVDSVVFSIISQFVNRAKFGKAKYGTDLDRTDLSILDWIQHAKEEHMDAILYLEKIKNEYMKEKSIK
jgi:hypothetical protein